jgi:SH3-like domain-containing protein
MAAILEQEGCAIVPGLRHQFQRVLGFQHMLAGALALGLLTASLVPDRAAAAGDEAEGPYWASLRTQPANLRVGPGREYRIGWVYVRGGLPLKVLRTMGGWRLVEDIDGARGWMLAQFLARARTATVKGSIAEIRENADGTGRLLWHAEPGVTGKLGECGAMWCKIDIDGRRGSVAKAAIWGAD